VHALYVSLTLVAREEEERRGEEEKRRRGEEEKRRLTFSTYYIFYLLTHTSCRLTLSKEFNSAYWHTVLRSAIVTL
jgi:hypothetical protein